MDIDIGYGTFDGDGEGATNCTHLGLDNPANATGVLTSFSLWFATAVTDGSCKVGTFSGSGTDYDDRDYELIGNVSAGAEQVFTGKNCDVVIGDFGGLYMATGTPERNSTGGLGRPWVSGDKFGAGVITYTVSVNYRLAFYATGVTVPDAPTSVSATDNLSDKVTITWTAGTGETSGNKVYRDGSVLNSDTAIAHDTNTFDDTTGVAGTTYAYTVKAINPAGMSAASTADNGTRVSRFNSQIIIF
jgi:hypothetical protein